MIKLYLFTNNYKSPNKSYNYCVELTYINICIFGRQLKWLLKPV